ncbi:sterile alpha motif domain-containing protein 1-like isoform X10 [Elephas maximus indicus]|uniref:sterile alpha motif domain-containing protein 1-like isoform X10 n=1 Tax=Elephas maximus indicus TaxID=99487 RepID=UPI002116D87C|nr:sterile alpha motif domain-containing protein 1-like isoform X10 [Elephas maximus indicus]
MGSRGPSPPAPARSQCRSVSGPPAPLAGDPRAPVPALRARLPLPSPPRSLRLRRFRRDPGPAGAAAFRRPRRWGPASLAAFPGESVGIVAARRKRRPVELPEERRCVLWRLQLVLPSVQ